MKIRAGFIQFAPILGNQERNILKLTGLFRKAEDANLYVLPELANSGYNFESKEQAFELAVETSNSKFIDFLSDQARTNNAYIVSGINEKECRFLYNTAVLVGPEGYIGKYRKIHLFMNEFDIFEKGNLGLPVFDIGFCKIGMLVCFDWMFPEVWRILALKGADIICHPSNLVLPYAQQAVPVHGMINRTFNITANRYGTEKDVTFSGQSIISDPYGNTMYKASSDAEDVKILELDLSKAQNKNITNRNHALIDRRPELYTEIVDGAKKDNC
jgi:predicted amidohydrolase